MEKKDSRWWIASGQRRVESRLNFNAESQKRGIWPTEFTESSWSRVPSYPHNHALPFQVPFQFPFEHLLSLLAPHWGYILDHKLLNVLIFLPWFFCQSPSFLFWFLFLLQLTTAFLYPHFLIQKLPNKNNHVLKICSKTLSWKIS